MKTRDSPPPPVHFHVPETTPVHVHMRRSPCRTPQIKAKDTQLRGDGGRPKRSRGRASVGKWIGHQWDEEEAGRRTRAEYPQISLVLLREQDSIRQLKKSDSRRHYDSLAKDKRLSKLHASSLARQQDLLLEKIEMFDHTNHSLRELLRDWSEYERESLGVDTTERCHKEEIDCQGCKQSQELQQEELHTQQGELQTLRQRRDEEQGGAGAAGPGGADPADPEGRASGGRTPGSSQRKCRRRNPSLAQALSTSRDWSLRCSREAAAKAQLEEHVSALRFQVTELSSQRLAVEVGSRAEEEGFRVQLHHLSAENTSINVDNQRLKGHLTSAEEKLGALQSEARRMKSSIKKQEQLVQQVRLESEESLLKLETTQREAREVKLSLERGTEQVRRGLLGRLREMEALPDRLRRAEQQLRDAQQEAEDHQRRNVEHNSALSEVRHKVEQQGTQLEMLQQKNLLLQEENNVLKEKTQNFERHLTVENQEMSEALPSKEASLRSIQQQLEEKSHEVSFLSRQLQTTLDDAQRQVDASMQKVLVKEKASQSKALDLQSLLSRAKTEQSQLQRSKEEMERRFQSQLQNMKDRLEQSDSTNRSLQNYVHFLKTSYGNVFGDSSLAS
ncbi:hypothetical protein KUCAC02_029176 [Chaenocephalus aceratus]|uniref:Uncharacterized protein n=1 Tax=Chaenocephalus aceratus TaxID=36190 RepID=A0ACB9X4P1_CHAAC|nr:hypothetical protein KUCAC02_029176 [Chaenocephalus aceratus]